MLATRVVRIAFAAIALGRPTATFALSPSPGPAPNPVGAQSPSPDPAAAAGASLVDYYTADRSATPDREQLELRLRDDGRAWFVTAPVPALPAASAASPPPGRFETGTWQAGATGVNVALDSVSSVVGGRPLDPQPEKRDLTFTFAACGLTLVTDRPPSPDVGPGGIAFAKRHCR
jgi:hypothetical protein